MDEITHLEREIQQYRVRFFLNNINNIKFAAISPKFVHVQKAIFMKGGQGRVLIHILEGNLHYKIFAWWCQKCRDA